MTAFKSNRARSQSRRGSYAQPVPMQTAGAVRAAVNSTAAGASGDGALILVSMDGIISCGTVACAAREARFMVTMCSAATQLGWPLSELCHRAVLNIGNRRRSRDSEDLGWLEACRIRYLDLPEDTPFLQIATFFMDCDCRFVLLVLKHCCAPRESLLLASLGLAKMAEEEKPFRSRPEFPLDDREPDRRILEDALFRLRRQAWRMPVPGVKFFAEEELMNRLTPVSALYFAGTPACLDKNGPGRMRGLDGLIDPDNSLAPSPLYPRFGHVSLAVMSGEARLRGMKRVQVRRPRGGEEPPADADGSSERRGADDSGDPGVETAVAEGAPAGVPEAAAEDAPAEAPAAGVDRRHSLYIGGTDRTIRRSMLDWLDRAHPGYLVWRGNEPLPRGPKLSPDPDHEVALRMAGRLRENGVPGYDEENLYRSNAELGDRQKLLQDREMEEEEAGGKADGKAAKKTGKKADGKAAEMAGKKADEKAAEKAGKKAVEKTKGKAAEKAEESPSGESALNSTMKFILAAAMVAGTGTLSGCGSITGLNASEDFSCPNQTGVNCRSLSDTYALEQKEGLPWQQAERAEAEAAAAAALKAELEGDQPTIEVKKVEKAVTADSGTTNVTTESVETRVIPPKPVPAESAAVSRHMSPAEREFALRQGAGEVAALEAAAEREAELAQAAEAARSGTTAKRLPERIVSIRFTPWTDEQGDLHEGNRVLVRIAPARWATAWQGNTGPAVTTAKPAFLTDKAPRRITTSNSAPADADPYSAAPTGPDGATPLGNGARLRAAQKKWVDELTERVRRVQQPLRDPNASRADTGITVADMTERKENE
ncbi:TraV family lipoprotein [Sutterella sp.]|uniref:TraV family lipoprotein n=1 Tax=Sutterella sp. TaxID=1981025 RepID=UPI0026DFC27C|nr:TraV family lipoprotein [Sutterella sp.]MDO5531906.1 TraV family lipoprotein [Sutterella sp.]